MPTKIWGDFSWFSNNQGHTTVIPSEILYYIIASHANTYICIFLWQPARTIYFKGKLQNSWNYLPHEDMFGSKSSKKKLKLWDLCLVVHKKMH